MHSCNLTEHQRCQNTTLDLIDGEPVTSARGDLIDAEAQMLTQSCFIAGERG